MSGAQRAAVHLLVARNLRLAERSGGMIRLRLLAALVLLFVMWWLSRTYGVRAAPGAGLVSALVRIDFVATYLAGVFLYPALIVQEREQRTLPLLRLAGFDSWRFMLGQSLGALVQSLLLLGVQVPFLMLAVALGGTSTDAIGRELVVLLANAVLVYGLAMLAAARARTMGQATVRAGFLQLLPIVSYACPILQPFTPGSVLAASGVASLRDLWFGVATLTALGVGMFVLATLIFDHGDRPAPARGARWISRRWRRFTAGQAAVGELLLGVGRSVPGVLTWHLAIVALLWFTASGPGWVGALLLVQVALMWLGAASCAVQSVQGLREAQMLPLLYLALGDEWLLVLRRRRLRLLLAHIAVLSVTSIAIARDVWWAFLGTVAVTGAAALFADRFGERAGLFHPRAPMAVAVLGGGTLLGGVYVASFLVMFFAPALVVFLAISVLVYGGLAMLVGNLNRHGLTKLYGR